MKLKEVKIGDELYSQAREIRKDVLFQDIEDVDFYMNDPWENKSVHAIVEHEGKAVGVGRLTFDEDGNGVISQVAILPEFRKLNIGATIVEHLVKLSVFNSSEKVYMSATESSIGFFEKCGFNAIGAKFSSPKTGIVHVSMVLVL